MTPETESLDHGLSLDDVIAEIAPRIDEEQRINLSEHLSNMEPGDTAEYTSLEGYPLVVTRNPDGSYGYEHAAPVE